MPRATAFAPPWGACRVINIQQVCSFLRGTGEEAGKLDHLDHLDPLASGSTWRGGPAANDVARHHAYDVTLNLHVAPLLLRRRQTAAARTVCGVGIVEAAAAAAAAEVARCGGGSLQLLRVGVPHSAVRNTGRPSQIGCKAAMSGDR